MLEEESNTNVVTVDETIFHCEICDVDYFPHLATYECSTCNEKMCDILARAYRKQKITQHHQLLTLPQNESRKDLPVMKKRKDSHDRTFCNVHNATLDIFDEQCQRLNCIQCFMTEHKGTQYNAF
jgi:hypothetical protein